jgi:hypothetical protein
LRFSPSEALEPSRSSSRLIADGDSVARNAFRVGLREDTPLPFATGRSGTAGVTQELDPGDILEVQDMAAAIARAEKLVSRSSQTLLPAPAPAPPSSHDIFESLGRRTTDDTAGPATPAPIGVLTPVPPAYAAAPPATAAPVAHPTAAPAPSPPAPRYLTMPSAPPTGIDEDAFYHPLGRMRSLADATLDGYRPEPTLLVRAASRRKRFSWLFVAALLPLLVLAAIAIFANAGGASSTSVASSPRAPSVSATTKLALATTSAAMKSPSVTGAPEPPPVLAAQPGAARAATGTPVFDVKSLPTAGARPRR